MTDGITFAVGARSTPVPLLAVFCVGGLVAVWCGINWAFDIRGITTRRSERIRRRNADVWASTGRIDAGAGSLFGSTGYHRFLGAVMAVAGLFLLLVTVVLWHLG